jgi:hypothetical protein
VDTVPVTRDFTAFPTYGLTNQTTTPHSQDYSVSAQNSEPQSHVLVSSNQGVISRSDDFSMANQNAMTQPRDFNMSHQNPAPCVMEQDILTDVFTNTINSNLSSQGEDSGFDIPNYHSVMHSS